MPSRRLAFSDLRPFTSGRLRQHISRCQAAGWDIRIALLDRVADVRVLHFQIVFQFVNIQNAGNRNPVLFENEVFLVDMRAFYDVAEVNACLGDGKTMRHSVCG